MSPLKIATVFLLQSLLSAASFADIDYENYFCDTEAPLMEFPAVSEAVGEACNASSVFVENTERFKDKLKKIKSLVKQLQPGSANCLTENERQGLIRRFQQLDSWIDSWIVFLRNSDTFCVEDAKIQFLTRAIENAKDRSLVERDMLVDLGFHCMAESFSYLIML